MKTVVIKGQKRETLGKKESKKLRAQDIVPAVLYGGEEVIHFSIPFKELRSLVYTPNVYLIDLDIDGEIYHSMMQDIQWHAVEEMVMHVDFFKIDADKAIKIEVPVTVSGLAKGIQQGGKLILNLRRLKVKALAKNLPDAINVDVTELELGQSVKVDEIDTEDIELLDTKSNVIVSVNITRLAKAAVAEDEAAEAAEEVEGEEGGEGDEAEASAEE